MAAAFLCRSFILGYTDAGQPGRGGAAARKPVRACKQRPVALWAGWRGADSSANPYLEEIEARMSVDTATVRRIAHLARIAVKDDEIEHLQGELNAMLAFVEQLQEVNVEGIEPMTSVTPMAMKKREDVVTDGGIADDIVKNAPATEDHFFLVPKVVE
jgi:aspartyl-tRNA(Asn)/glutamyl-tRNA(Gln) amidotransferase subunit C